MMMVMIELMRGWWGLKEQKWAESLFWRRFMRWGGNSDVTLRRERKCLKVETAASCGRKQKWTSWHRAPLWLICVLVHLYCSIIRGDGQLFGNEEDYLWMSIFPQKEHYSFNSNSEPLVAIKTFDMTRLAGFVKTILFCHYVEQKYSSHFMQKWIKKELYYTGASGGLRSHILASFGNFE